MTIARLVLMLVCLMSVTLEPKDAKVTPLLSKDLTDFPGKEGLMITVEYPPGSSDPITHMRLFMCLKAQSLCR
jgi:hypothetical protein